MNTHLTSEVFQFALTEVHQWSIEFLGTRWKDTYLSKVPLWTISKLYVSVMMDKAIFSKIYKNTWSLWKKCSHENLTHGEKWFSVLMKPKENFVASYSEETRQHSSPVQPHRASATWWWQEHAVGCLQQLGWGRLVRVSKKLNGAKRLVKTSSRDRRTWLNIQLPTRPGL